MDVISKAAIVASFQILTYSSPFIAVEFRHVTEMRRQPNNEIN